MRTKWEILYMLIGYKDPHQLVFMVDGERVSFDIEDIYFITRLSHRGQTFNLYGSG